MTAGQPTSPTPGPDGPALAASLLAAYNGDGDRVLGVLEEALAVLERRATALAGGSSELPGDAITLHLEHPITDTIDLRDPSPAHGPTTP